MMKSKWTEERKLEHSNAMKGRPGTKKLKGVPKTAEHNRKNSEALKGVPKTEEHRKNLSEAVKFRKVCRLLDHKEMSVTHFTRWLNSIVELQP